MPGQGSPPSSIGVTLILHSDFPLHFVLTIASDVVDIQCVVVICEWEHTLPSSVLPYIAFSIKMIPVGHVIVMIKASHVITVFLALKKMKKGALLQ